MTDITRRNFDVRRENGMLSVRKTSPGFGLEIVDVPLPGPPGPGDVLIEVSAAGICGSDIHAYEWTAGYEFMTSHMPLTVGHEFAGTILEVGTDVTHLRKGESVAVWPIVGCGHCLACLDDRRQDCPSRRVIGLHHDGAFAERVVVPADCCFVLPSDLEPRIGALAEPFAVAQNAVDIAEIKPDDVVVVLGPGPIGLAIAWLVHKTGAKTILVGLDNDRRLATARAMGLDTLVDLRDESLPAAIARLVGRQVDRVIEATGAVQSIHDAIDILRSSGILVVVGIHSKPLELDLTRFVRSKLQLRAAHDSPRHVWERIITVLHEHADEVRPMITHELPMERALEGFELARRREASKVMLHLGANIGKDA
jgi:L-iditol 2-dehydrogenase